MLEIICLKKSILHLVNKGSPLRVVTGRPAVDVGAEEERGKDTEN